MDRKLSEKTEIERLIRLSNDARTCLASEAAAFRKRLDIPERLRGSLGAHPAGWMLGSLGSGLLASAIFRRRPRPAAPKRKGGLLGLLGLILTAAAPLAKVWIANLIKDWMTRQSQAAPAPRSQARSQHS